MNAACACVVEMRQNSEETNETHATGRGKTCDSSSDYLLIEEVKGREAKHVVFVCGE